MNVPAQRTRLVAGCMTGTSLDGLDAAVVRIDGSGLSMSATVVRTLSAPLGELAPRLRAVADQRPVTAGEIAGLAREFGLLHARALGELLSSDRADLIAVHGQTVFHKPPLSWQLINPAPIAHALGAPIVFDLRSADLAAEGQGAPITPLADFVLFRSPEEPRLVVNLGGFCNVTLVPRVTGEPDTAALTTIRARDVCPCNQILDAIARRCFDALYDDDGRHALAGRSDREAALDLGRGFESSSDRPRSLGTGDEHLGWIERHAGRLSGADLAASACAAIATAVIAAGEARADARTRLIAAGGSVKNRALVGALHAMHVGGGRTYSVSDDLGVPAAFREAAAMAVLGALCQDRVPITLPRVTGVAAPAPIAGVWVWPGGLPRTGG